MCQLQKLVLKEAASQRQGFPLISLSGVGDPSPSWVQSWVGARSYCRSQLLPLGCSSSQPLDLSCANRKSAVPWLSAYPYSRWPSCRTELENGEAAGTTWDSPPHLPSGPTRSWAILLGLHTLSSPGLHEGPSPAPHISPALAVLESCSCCKVVCLSCGNETSR